MITVSAPGKIHLLGEHAVVYGKPAIITTVDLRIIVSVIPSEMRNLKIEKKESRDSSLVAQNDIKKVLENIVRKRFKLRSIPPYEIKIDSNLPIGSGLGSSAAVSASYIAALLTLIDHKWDLNLINELTFEAEKVFHGNPSGADNSTVVYGGLVWYRKESENLKIIQKLPFFIPTKLSKNFLIINTGTPKVNTKQMIDKITALFEKKPKLKKEFLESQEQLVRELLPAIKKANEKELIKIIREGEKNLESIGVASKEVVSIIRIIESIGGAAKICGAGAFSGPTGVLLCYHPKKGTIEKIAEENNFSCFSTRLGVEGIKYEL